MFYKAGIICGASLFALSVSAAAEAQGGTAPAPGAPQSQARDGSSPGIDDIIVTAQRRAENLQDVPVAISAFTGETLEKLAVQEFTQLAALTPGVVLTSQNGSLSTNVRGVGGNVGGPGIELQTAVYLDDVYFSFVHPSVLELGGISQVAVLKGPQGTLFGRNATAGVVQITTLDPPDQTSFRTKISYENYDRIQASAYVGTKLAEGISADIGAVYAHQGKGWGKNLVDGRDVYDTDHQYAIRSKWKFTPGENTTITVIGDLTDSRDRNSVPVTTPGTINPAIPGVVQPDRGYNSNLNGPDEVNTHAWGVSGKLVHDFGGVELTSISAYRKGDLSFLADSDGTPLNLTNQSINNFFNQFTQEVRLQSSSSASRLKWVVGGFYLDGSARVANVINAVAGGINRFIDDQQDVKSVAGFGQATFALTDSTNVTGGVRYTDETKNEKNIKIDVRSIASGALVSSTPFPDRKLSFSRFTYRAALDHRFSDAVMAYASFNKGFKSGGFNTVSPGAPPFAPESVNAFEVGLKTDFLDRRVRLNLSAYHYDYSNIQVITFVTGQLAIINGPAAKIYGVEGDLELALWRGLRVSSGFNWGSPKFGSWNNTCPILNPAGGRPATIGECKGNLVPLATEFTANGRVDYETDMAEGKVRLNAVASYNSGYFFSPDNAIKMGAHVIVNSSASWTDSNDRLTISVYGRNLTDKRVTKFINSNAGNGTFLSRFNAPRTYGVSIGYKY